MKAQRHLVDKLEEKNMIEHHDNIKNDELQALYRDIIAQDVTDEELSEYIDCALGERDIITYHLEELGIN